MALIPAISPGQFAAGGLFGGLFKSFNGFFGKATPRFLLTLLPILFGTVMGGITTWWLGKKHHENSREPEGSHARVHRAWWKRFVVWMPLMMLAIFALRTGLSGQRAKPRSPLDWPR